MQRFSNKNLKLPNIGRKKGYRHFQKAVGFIYTYRAYTRAKNSSRNLSQDLLRMRNALHLGA